MGDASGVKAAQRDQGEARRSGVISRRLRRLTSAIRFEEPSFQVSIRMPE
jgi:hypothetical protein